MAESFQARIGGEGEDPLPAGAVPLIEVPEAIVEALGHGKRPRVSVTIRGHTFRSTVAVYGGQYYLPLNKENRARAAAELGERVEVALELDTAAREVELPPDLATALAADPTAAAVFERLAYSTRKEHAEAIASAKQEETRRRRLDRVLALLASLRETSA